MPDRRRLRATGHQRVRLSRGAAAEQLEEARTRFADFPIDSLLYPFRVRRGMPAPGVPLRGWYGEGLFNNVGQFMSMFARLYAATRDDRLAIRTRELVEGWAETIDESGYAFSSMVSASREYSYDKMVCGLLDAHEHVGVPGALPALRRISEWMLRYGDRSRPYAWHGSGPLEWYTLSEYLYRAFAITGDELYRELADRYFYGEFFALIRRGDETKLHRAAEEAYGFYQAHSHLSSFNGAAARFSLTGEPAALSAAVAGYNYVRDTQSYPTGSFGPLESFTKAGQIAEALHVERAHAEVPCPAWAMIRLTRHLIELTGHARYGDWMELNIYNGTGAAPITNEEGVATQYFADYGRANARKTRQIEWSCCSTTTPICVAEVPNQVALHGENAVHIVLFLPSEIDFEFEGARGSLALRTRFPASELVEVDVKLDRPARGVIAFRAPDWLAATPVISVDDIAVEPEWQDGWIRVAREWRGGETIRLTLPMQIEAVPGDPTRPDGPVALRYGPVVLVVPDVVEPTLRLVDVPAILASAKRRDDSVWFQSQDAAGERIDLVPYADIGVDRPYAMHIDDEDDARVSFHHLRLEPPDAWRTEDLPALAQPGRRTYASSERGGAYFELEFQGRGVLWYGYHSPLGGYADIEIDGRHVARISQRSGSALPAWMWRHTGLSSGTHRMRVSVVGEGPPSSLGCAVNVHHIRAIA